MLDLATCAACGTAGLPTSDETCPNCGVSITAKEDGRRPRLCPSTMDLSGEPEQKLPPIAGWLVLPALGLLLSPLRNVYEIWSSWQMLNNPLFTSAAERVPAINTAVAWELGMNVLYLGLLLYVAALFFRRKKTAPRAYIGLMLALLGCALVSEFILRPLVNLQPDGTTLLKAVIPCVIWIPYFLVSKRVAETFTVD